MAAVDKTKRVGRWYFGGVASAMAACCTHPLDLMKVWFWGLWPRIKLNQFCTSSHISKKIQDKFVWKTVSKYLKFNIEFSAEKKTWWFFSR